MKDPTQVTRQRVEATNLVKNLINKKDHQTETTGFAGSYDYSQKRKNI